MKTPMQILLEKIENGDFFHPKVIGEFIKYNLLEKERSLLIKTHGNKKVYDSQIDPTIVTGEEWYNKTFKTKEK